MTSAGRPAETQLTVFHGSCKTHRVAWGLTCEELEDLHAHSGHACGICGRPGPGLVNDHDHALGRYAIRGTLCYRCNGSYMSRVDNGEYPVAERAREYLRNPWYLAREGRSLPYDPAISVSVNNLSGHDRRELERLINRYLFSGTTLGNLPVDAWRRTYEHPAIATAVSANDFRPVKRLLRMAFMWRRLDLDISATGPDVPGGMAEHNLHANRRAA